MSASIKVGTAEEDAARTPPQVPGSVAQRRRWTRAGLWLVGLTMAYNVVEGLVSLWFGSQAQSVALLGFGLDSMIETAAAGVLLWRLRLELQVGVDPQTLARSERRVRRFVGGSFLLLAAYVTLDSAWTLWHAEAAQESLAGVVIASASLLIMPGVAWAKLRAAKEIGSAALRAEAKETLACSYLSLALLLGLAANAAAGWWWADPLAAMLMVPWLLKEGREGLEGEVCEGCD